MLRRPAAFTRPAPCCRARLQVSASAVGPSNTEDRYPDELSRRGVLAAAGAGSLYAFAQRASAAPVAGAPPLAAAAGASSAPLRARLEERVSEFTLSNGMHFIVCERRDAPVFAAHLVADVGAYDEDDGSTGIAHLLEHMAFKGTETIGTKDYAAEAPLLDALDEVFYAIRDSRSHREQRQLKETMAALIAKADALAEPNAFGALLQREGAQGLNASTSHDATRYYCALPANKLELWFALEAERFQAPVFRGLYKEKEVVLEERRLRVDNSPLGAWQESFAGRSLGNNYRRPVIGYEDDIRGLGRREVQAFYERHYGPASLTAALTGDVDPAVVQRLAEKYFGGWGRAVQPTASCSGAGAAEEPLAWPEGGVPRSFQDRSRAGPAVVQAYYRPCGRSPDSVPLDLANDLLTGSRSSRLYSRLVLGGKALSVSSAASYPAEKHPSQFLLFGIPAKSSSTEELDYLIDAELERLGEQGPSVAELARYKKAARVSLLEALQSNGALASALASYHRLTGDWRSIATEAERIEGLAPEEVQAVIGRYLIPGNCYKGTVLPLMQ